MLIHPARGAAFLLRSEFVEVVDEYPALRGYFPWIDSDEYRTVAARMGGPSLAGLAQLHLPQLPDGSVPTRRCVVVREIKYGTHTHTLAETSPF